MGLLEDFERGINMFSPFALSSEKKLARQIGPALAGVLGQEINASGQLAGDVVRTQGVIKSTGMKEAGDTFRQRLLNDAQILMRDMMEKGATQREGMQQGGATYRTKLGEEGAMQRLKKQALLQENAFDKRLMSKYAMQDIGSSLNTGEITDRIEESLANPTSTKKDKFSSLLDDYDYSSGTW